MNAEQPVMRFGPTSGVVTGVVGLIACATVVAISFMGDVTAGRVRVALAVAAVGVLIWAYMLRPRIAVDRQGGTLLLRNPFIDWEVPLASVKVVGVRMVTTVKTEEGGRYDCVAVGYPVRKIVRGTAGQGRPGQLPSTRPTDQSEQDLMVDQILAAADHAREVGLPDSPARRTPAWPEIVALALLSAGFVLSYLG